MRSGFSDVLATTILAPRSTRALTAIALIFGPPPASEWSPAKPRAKVPRHHPPLPSSLGYHLITSLQPSDCRTQPPRISCAKGSKMSPDTSAYAPWSPQDFIVTSIECDPFGAHNLPPRVQRYTLDEGTEREIALYAHDSASICQNRELIIGDWPSTPGCKIRIEPDTISIDSDTEAAFHIYYRTSLPFIAGTRLPELARCGDTQLDSDAFDELLAIGYPLGNRTLFKQIQRVPPSSRLIMDRHGSTSPRMALVSHSLLPDAESALHSLARRTAEWCDRGALLELSGGYDSRLVLALALHGGATKPRAFTLGTEETADGASASMLAKAAGIDFRLLPPTPCTDSLDLRRDGDRIAAASGYLLNYCEYAGFPKLFEQLAPIRDSQINGLGGELYTGSFNTPGDRLASSTRPSRWTWYRTRLLNSSHCFHELWPGEEANARLKGVLQRLDDEIFAYPGPDWRDRMRAYYRHTKMRNWGGAVISASNHWYQVHGPLWSLEFRSWSLANPGNMERVGQRTLTNQLVPEFAAIPYQKELEMAPRFKSQMRHRSNSTMGKIWLRLRKRRWLSNGAPQRAAQILADPATLERLELLESNADLGHPKFQLLMSQDPTRVSHPLGVGMTSACALSAIS